MKTELIKIEPRKVVKENKQAGIMNNGADNAYPSRMERIILASTTGKASAEMYANFLAGSGFSDEINKIVVGEVNYKPITMYDLLERIVHSVAYQNGAFIHLNIAYESADKFYISDVQPLLFKNCRLGLLDDTEYTGKIAIYDNWDKSKSSKIEKKKIRKVNVFNMKPEVITSQITTAGGFEKYKGQVYHQFLDNEYNYPLSPIDVAQDDADTESEISKYKNGDLRNGFTASYILRHAYFANKKDKQNFVDKIKEFQGAENRGSIMLIEDDITEDETTGMTVDNGLKFEKIEQTVNDKIFINYEKSVANNIRKAYKAIPTILIEYVEGKLGGTSGEALTAAADFYNEMTKKDRQIIENIFKDIFQHWKEPITDFEIRPLQFGDEEEIIDIAESKRLESQAALKGSVGGVTALMQLQQSVSEGTSDLSAAIAIVEEIYGISKEKATEMLGTPKPKTE
ncbi:MAG: hypothetical protein HN347_12215 [Bacteroidetes bacterium]|jgi:hypothetical protein|nr:hypothetical protein [Bacteroidota bacterium]